MIADAIDTATRIGWAIAAWIVLTSAAATLALHTVVVAVAWPPRTAWKAVTGALAASRALRALRAHPHHYRPAQRHTAPSWARTDHNRQEAA